MMINDDSYEPIKSVTVYYDKECIRALRFFDKDLRHIFTIGSDIKEANFTNEETLEFKSAMIAYQN